MRLVPLGQTDGQRIARARSSPSSPERAETAPAPTLDDLGAAAPMLDWSLDAPRNPVHEAVPLMSIATHGPLRVGIGGPVGSGKTALIDALCKAMRDRYDDRRDHQRHLHQRGRRVPDARRRAAAGAHHRRRDRRLPAHRDPRGRLDQPRRRRRACVARFPGLDLILIESGGDNLAATFSPELADLTIYVIDVSAGDKIPRKGGPGITRSDLLVINKIDLAPHVGADLEVMDRDARKMRGERPFVFTNLKTGEGLDEVVRFIVHSGGLREAA